jgi:hypothetical protein
MRIDSLLVKERCREPHNAESKQGPDVLVSMKRFNPSVFSTNCFRSQLFDWHHLLSAQQTLNASGDRPASIR